VVVVDTQAEVFEVIGARHSPCRLARRLNGRQKKRNQNSDYRDDDQKLNESKSVYIATPPHFNIVFFHTYPLFF